MDYRNDNRTPRDRVDEEFFRSILRDEELTEERNRVRPPVGDRAASASCGTGRCRREQAMPRTGKASQRSIGGCPCPAEDTCLSSFPPAMVYIPLQSFTGIMESAVALKRGTVFSALDLPFYHSGCKGDGCR